MSEYQQCQRCFRYFAEGEPVRLDFRAMAEATRAGLVEVDFLCGRPDCEPPQRNRHSQRRQCAPQPPRERHQPRRPAAASDVGRLPYADHDDAAQWPQQEPLEPAAMLERSPAPAAIAPSVGVVIERALTQAEYEASGAASSANARLIEFFEQPKNFNKWFPRTLLKQIARNDYINNRADDIREYFLPKGLYVDNANVSLTEDGSKTSHYRLCRIMEAASLNVEQKRALMERVNY